MNNSTSNGPDEDIISSTQIGEFLEDLHMLSLEQLAQLSTLLYGAIVPTVLNNHIVEHDKVIVYSFFILIKMWREDPSMFPEPAAIRFYDKWVFANVTYHYSDQEARKSYVDAAINDMFRQFLNNAKQIYGPR